MDKKDWLSYLQIIRDNIKTLPIDMVLEFTISSVPNHFMKKAEYIKQVVVNGGYLGLALEKAGLDKEISRQIYGFEIEGKLEDGLRIAIEILEKEVEIQSRLKKIDNKFYQVLGLTYIGIGAFVLWWLPKIAEKMISQIDQEKVEKDWLFNFISKAFTNMDYKIWITGYLIIGIILFILFIKFKVHRVLMRVLPQIRELERVNDKITVLNLFKVNNTEADAIRQMVRMFKNKWNLDKVANLFTTRLYDFSPSPLFEKEEKKLLLSLGKMGGDKSILEFLIKENSRKRDNLIDQIDAIMDTFRLLIGAMLVIGLWSFPVLIIMKIQSLLR